MNNTLKFLLLLAGLMLAGVVIFSGGFIRSAKVVHSMHSTSASGSTPQNESALARPTPEPRSQRPTGPPPRVIQGKAAEEPAQPQAAGTITNWQERVDEIVADTETEPEAKADHLLQLFPHLPPEGQEVSAEHLSNLVSDEHYAALGTLFTNSVLPEAVLDTLMSDVLNRPNNIKLPALLIVAQDARHPKAEEAHDILELQLDNDYGTNWTLWEQRLQEWLQAQQMQEGQPAATQPEPAPTPGTSPAVPE